MPNRIEARSAKAALTNATGRLPLLRLFSTPLKCPRQGLESPYSDSGRHRGRGPTCSTCNALGCTALGIRRILSHVYAVYS